MIYQKITFQNKSSGPLLIHTNSFTKITSQSTNVFGNLKFQWTACGQIGQTAAGHVGKDNKPDLLKFLRNTVDNAMETAPKTVISKNVHVQVC